MTADRDRGAATVWALALIGIVMTAALAASAAAAQALARQRAAATADVVALAAAQAAGEPCAQAERLARANDAVLESCDVAPGDGVPVDVVVSVSRPAPELLVRVLGLLGAHPADIRATARAGPPEDEFSR